MNIEKEIILIKATNSYILDLLKELKLGRLGRKTYRRYKRLKRMEEVFNKNIERY